MRSPTFLVQPCPAPRLAAVAARAAHGPLPGAHRRSRRSWTAGAAVAGSLAGCLLALDAGQVAAARRDYVGSAACGTCHPAQLAAWQATAHARTLQVAGAPLGPWGRCLGCHSTGDWPAGAIVERTVGCEACHGAGADYAADDLMRNRHLARDLGLVDLEVPAVRAQVCASCHASVALGRASLASLASAAHPALPAGGGQ